MLLKTGNCTSFTKADSSSMSNSGVFSVTVATSAIFAYWWLMPTLLYGLLWWRNNQAGYTYTYNELLCIYGYSLAIYVPISVSAFVSVDCAVILHWSSPSCIDHPTCTLHWFRRSTCLIICSKLLLVNYWILMCSFSLLRLAVAYPLIHSVWYLWISKNSLSV